MREFKSSQLPQDQRSQQEQTPPNDTRSGQAEPNPRMVRLQQRTRKQMQTECDEVASHLRERSDYNPTIEFFLEKAILSQFPEAFLEKCNKQVVLTLCIQVPMELFHAAGVQAFKLACGSHAAGNFSLPHLPALTCPMVKTLSSFFHPGVGLDPKWLKLVVPTTCDWVVRFCELAEIEEQADIHFMDLPHLRENETASRRWLDETRALKQWLEDLFSKRITPKALHRSIQLHANAFFLFNEIVNMRRAGQVPSLHFALITNAFPYMDVEEWATHAQSFIAALREAKGNTSRKKEKVYLTGSPIIFPNYKLLGIIEQAGLEVVADDICSMERGLPGVAAFEDRSEYALLRAIAERHHKACICPTFADNRRRIHAIFNVLEKEKINAVIFHVLKGCHPYDMEAGLLEDKLKKRGIRCIKIETDYVREDEQNILTRLEAFTRTLNTL